jgi:quercetin dioxygenase-like cupin family protein
MDSSHGWSTPPPREVHELRLVLAAGMAGRTPSIEASSGRHRTHRAHALASGSRAVSGLDRARSVISMARPDSPEFGTIFDFEAIVREMRSEEAYLREGHTARALVREHDMRVVLIAMKAGARIAKHVANETVSIQTLAGGLRLQLPRLARQREDRIVDLPLGRLLVLDRGLEHDVEAVGDSALLVTFGWNDKAPRT